MKFAVVGPGKMGRAIARRAIERGHVAGPEMGRVDADAGPGWSERLAGTDVAFEFTRPEAARANVLALLQSGVSVVCGTTGWTPDPAIAEAATRSGPRVDRCPEFLAGNAAVQSDRLLMRANGRRSQLYQATLHEAHHRGKRDMPSGTAKALARLVVEESRSIGPVVEGHLDQPIEPGALHVTATRSGGEPGTHTVSFDGEVDTIEMTHRARSRDRVRARCGARGRMGGATHRHAPL